MPQGSDQVGTLKGVDEDVPYDADDADSLASACRSSATLIDGQASTRSTAVTTAQEDFQGHFADLFTANAAVQVTDATNLAAALRDVATKVDALTEEARKEQQRRETARAWKRDHDNRGWAEKAWDAVFGEDPPAIGPAATPLNQCVPAPDTGTRETPEPGSAGASGASGGTSSADPADLRSFASTCRTEDDELSNEPTTLRSRYTTFESTCTWGSVDAAGVFTAYDTYLTNNDQDATWADTVAGAFEAAGGTGSVTTLPDAAIQAALDAAGVATERSEITIDLATVQGGALTNGYADDPVNTATGNFIEPEVDLAFTGGCASLALIRVYNATSREPGGFGPGWSSAADSRLDLDQDGENETFSMLASGSGFLALDKDGDGKVSDGGELFGTQSGNGFADLAQYDEDGNGWIDEGDTAFAQLKIWAQGEHGQDQLLSLTEAGVGALFLGSQSTEFSLKDNQHQLQGQVRQTGVFLRENGTAGTLQQIDLAV